MSTCRGRRDFSSGGYYVVTWRWLNVCWCGRLLWGRYWGKNRASEAIVLCYMRGLWIVKTYDGGEQSFELYCISMISNSQFFGFEVKVESGYRSISKGRKKNMPSSSTFNYISWSIPLFVNSLTSLANHDTSLWWSTHRGACPAKNQHQPRVPATFTNKDIQLLHVDL